MDKIKIEQLLNDVKNKKTPVSAAMKKLRTLPFEDIDFAKLDHHRSLRTDHSEIIYCAGKTDEQIIKIFRAMSAKKLNIMGTRVNVSTYNKLKKIFPKIKYNKEGRVIVFEQHKTKKNGNVLILTGGTSDIPVAEEARATAEFLGSNVESVFDVGVSGIHRLFSVLDKVIAADVIISIAGMEGALASVVAGLTDRPVIAVPTSVGYGAAFKGLAALLSMINSCAAGVSVVNIDNGFGAGVIASRIIKK